jgi:uncharacterized protein with HEPN domain
VRDARDRLQHILEAIGHIERYAARGRQADEALYRRPQSVF